jgi:hypothetical protein
MFHFPALPPPALCVQAGVTGYYALSGFPIRKSPDQCLVADFPGLIAGSNVLLRLLVPRHPPCALINLATTIDARVHCAVLKIRAVPVRTPPRYASGGAPVRETAKTPVPSGPNSVLGQAAPPPPFQSRGTVLAGLSDEHDRITSAPRELPSWDTRPRHGSGRDPCVLQHSEGPRQVLLRKEVIQPHLPVRLPCYDFVPIADPTFDGSLPYGLGHRLRVLPTFVT